MGLLNNGEKVAGGFLRPDPYTVAGYSRDRLRWHLGPETETPVKLSLILGGEVGEVHGKVEHYVRKRNEGESLDGLSESQVVGIGKEIGDVLWGVDAITAQYRLSLSRIVGQRLRLMSRKVVDIDCDVVQRPTFEDIHRLHEQYTNSNGYEADDAEGMMVRAARIFRTGGHITGQILDKVPSDEMAGSLGKIVWELQDLAAVVGVPLVKLARQNIETAKRRVENGTVVARGDDR
jgi:NTP pyrophosphatase (non-canonical NTP hydrolase)